MTTMLPNAFVCEAAQPVDIPESKPADLDGVLSNSSFNPDIHVPGLWRCAKCNFVLAQRNLNATNGSVTARDEPGDRCPNDGAILWRMTWKQHAKDMEMMSEAVHERHAAEITRINTANLRRVVDLDIQLATFRRVTQGIAAAREKQLAAALEENRMLRDALARHEAAV